MPASSCCCSAPSAMCGPPIHNASRGYSLVFVIASIIEAACYFYWSDLLNPGPRVGWGGNTDFWDFWTNDQASGIAGVGMKEIRACVSFGFMAGVFLLLGALYFLVCAVTPLHLTHHGFGSVWAFRVWFTHLLTIFVAHPFGLIFGAMYAHIYRHTNAHKSSSGRFILLMPIVCFLFDVYGNFILYSAYSASKTEQHGFKNIKPDTLPPAHLEAVVDQDIEVANKRINTPAAANSYHFPYPNQGAAYGAHGHGQQQTPQLQMYPPGMPTYPSYGMQPVHNSF